ncbi:MAG: Dyp-type peroxidase [Gammaproteobacteria bacterium]|nr:Dyp-type peroxidase [Gammaproteobacteria bacterium]
MYQTGIFDETPTHHFFLEYVLADGADRASVASCIATLSRVVDPARMVLAFGTGLARQLFCEAVPADFSDFEPITGKQQTVPATPRDLWVWVHADNSSDALDAMLAVHEVAQSAFDLALDVAGFRYHDSRDLTGFVDGSANPKGDARHAAALVQTGPATAGSIVFTQRWEHNLTAFHALATSEQERVIGRTKPDSIELEGDAMPADSHVSRTDLKVNGVPMKIYRRSVPFASAKHQGLYFLAFTTERRRIDVILAHMFGTSDDKVTDRLTQYSKPSTGAFWFAPSQAALASVGG